MCCQFMFLLCFNWETSARLNHYFFCRSTVDSSVQENPVRLFWYGVTWTAKWIKCVVNHLVPFLSVSNPTEKASFQTCLCHTSCLTSHSFFTIWVKCFPICQYSPCRSRGSTWPRVSSRPQNAFEGPEESGGRRRSLSDQTHLRHVSRGSESMNHVQWRLSPPHALFQRGTASGSCRIFMVLIYTQT